MTVPFANVPAQLLTPLFYGEVNNSQANTALPIQRTLILGQKTGLGTGITDAVVRLTNTNDGITQAGANSQLAQMIDDYRANDPSGEVWIALLHDDGAATQATASITFTAVATAAGSYVVYIGGRKYAIAVTTAMLVADLATALTAAINQDKRGTVTAVAVAGAVNLTGDSKGPTANDCPIYENYFGAPGGEVMPKGLATTIVAFSGGTISPSLANILAAVGDKTFDFIVCPYNDTTTLNALQTFLSDVNGRWSWTSQTYGHVFFAATTNLSGLLNNYGAGTRNNQHESVMGWKNAGWPAWRLAAAYAAACAASLRIDPAMPLQTVPVLGVMPPQRQDRFQLTDRNTLLHNGVSTFTVGDDGTFRLENVVTTYQQNAFGYPDNSYLEVETMFTIVAVLRTLRSSITSKYARTKLASPNTPIAPGAAVVSTSTIKGELIAQYRGLCLAGLCQNPDAFKAGLVVEQDANNPNRVNVLYDPVLMAQLRVFAVLFQFRNMAPTSF